MNGGLIIPDKETAKALNDLARHKAIVRILNDIRMDMEICEIEGWDKNEYLNLIRQLLNSIGGKTMNDLISRQAAISLAGDLQIHGDEYHMYNQAINNYCTEIMGLPPAEPETRWIPCSERKPDTGYYLVWMPFAPPENRMAVAKYNGEYWNIKTAISAYMPLPEPYGEDGDE